MDDPLLNVGERGDFGRGFAWFDNVAPVSNDWYQPFNTEAAALDGSGGDGSTATGPEAAVLVAPVEGPLLTPGWDLLHQPLLPGGMVPLQPLQPALQQGPPAPMQAPQPQPPLSGALQTSSPSSFQQHPNELKEEHPDPGAADGRGGGQGRGGGRGGRGKGRASDDERRARNRATQARFRERQKAKNEQLAADHAATASQLERSQAEKVGLEAHNAVLHKLLSVKDEVLARLGPAGAAGAVGVADGGGPGSVLMLAAPEESPAGPRGPHLQELRQAESWGAGPSASASASGGASGGAGGGAGDAGGDATSGTPGGSSSGLSSSVGAAASGEWHLPGTAAAAAADSALHRRGVHRSLSGGSSGGLSRAVAEQYERLGNDVNTLMAQLDLPVTEHPDKVMCMSLAKLASSQPALLALPDEAAQQQAAAASVTAAEQRQDKAGEQGRAGPGQPAVEGAGGTAGQLENLAALVRQRPDLLPRIRAMSAEEFIKTWQALGEHVRGILDRHREQQSEAELEQILHIFRDWGSLFSLTLHCKPENVQALFATAADMPTGLLANAAADLAPTRMQTAMLQQLWHAYAARVQAIRAEREAAVQAVHSAAQYAATASPGALPASTLSALTARYLSLFDAAGRLSSLQDAEVVAMLELMGRTGAVFAPIQKARIAAACWPYFPDVVQLVSLLAGAQAS